MKKIAFIIICFGLSASVNFSQTQPSSKNNEVKKVKTKFQKRKKDDQAFVFQSSASVNSIELNQTEIDSNRIVKVRINATTLDNDKYVYSVSAGKIIGEGKNVEWDLSGVKPGIYTITAGISQFSEVWGWRVFGETKMQTVTVR